MGFPRRLAALMAVGAGAGFGAAEMAASWAAGDRVVAITVRQFEFDPPRLTLKREEPVVLELRSLDRKHGLKAPGLGLRVDVEPGQVVRLRLVPDRAGTFTFICDVFCGDSHDEMDGTIMVVD